jgi:hypothetical protein
VLFRSPLAAAGYIDIYGCPVDADYDGVPDYRDRCLSGPFGAAVDDDGCPVDSDGDGVPDYLDRCAETPPEVTTKSVKPRAFFRAFCISSMLSGKTPRQIGFPPHSRTAALKL